MRSTSHTNTVGRERSPIAAVFTIAVFALALRLLHVYFTHRDNVLASDLTLDALIYDKWARALLAGGDPGPTRLMQAPLYPWFISIVYRMFGTSLAALRIVQALLGTVSCIIVTVITRRLFRSLAASIAAGMAAAAYLPAIFYEGILVPASLILFLNLLYLVILVPYGGKPGGARLLAAGAVLGLSVMAKPVAILLLPFTVIHLFICSRPGGGRGTRTTDLEGASSGGGGNVRTAAAPGPSKLPSFARSTAALAAGLIIALAPLVIRNAYLAGEFVAFTTGGGINFYIGNNPDANGFYAVPFFRGRPIGGTPEEQRRLMHSIACSQAGRPLKPSEVSSFWFGQGLEFIREQPGRWASLLWRKFIYFWNGYERANVENMSFHRRFGGILGLQLLTFGIIAPLGLLGIFVTRHRWRDLWPLYGGILTYLAAALAFYVLARYRLPVVAFLFPFAGAALSELFGLARSRRIGELAVLTTALVLLAYFTNRTVAKDTPGGIAGNLIRLGDAYTVRGDARRARDAYREALGLDPKNERARRRLEKLAPR